MMNTDNLYRFLEIGAALGAVALGFFTYFFTKKKKAKNAIEFPQPFWQSHVKIQDILAELRIHTDCARAQLVQFHNTGNFLDGISMKKMSLTHESVARSIEREGKEKQDILLTMFLPLLHQVKENNTRIRHTKDMEESYCRSFLESNNVILYSILPIRIQGIIMGYVMVQWCNSDKHKKLNIESLDDVMKKCRNLLEVELVEERKKTE